MKSIENIIKDTVLRETNSSIKIDDSHFFSVLTERKNSKKLWGFIALLAAAVFCVAMLISFFVFFINDVLLFENAPKINESGAIIPERSCNRQSVLFLFNSAEKWANTGIQLQEGDEIKISYSGGFNSDIAGLVNSAKTNDTLRYKWVSFSNPDKHSKSDDLLFDKSKGGYFGSLLRVIAGEMGVTENDMDNIVQVEQEKTDEITENGTLYLSVNDIFPTDSIMKNKYGVINNPNAFFNDNLGDVLVVIDIKRKLSPFSWRSSWYRNTEESMNRALDKDNFFCRVFSVMWAIIVSLGYFIRILWYVFIPVLFIFIVTKRK